MAGTGIGAGLGSDDWRGKDSRMVPGTGGMGTAGARQPQHRGGPAAAGDEGDSESAHQAPRNFSALCAIDSGGENRRVVRESASVAVYDAGVLGAARKARQNSRAHTRGWNRPAADSDAGGQSALSRADQRIRTAD